MKTIYVSCESETDMVPALKKAARKLASHKRIGLISTAQHLRALDEAASFLRNQGKKAVIGGQVLGCNIENAERIKKKVDAFLFIGSGRFHQEALYSIDKPLLVLNPYSCIVGEIGKKEREAYLKKKKARMMKAAEAKIFGVVVSTKTLQFNPEKAEEIRDYIEQRGKKAYIFTGQEINPGRLLGYGIDAYVNTGCPRIAEDVFEKPVLNPDELKTLL